MQLPLINIFDTPYEVWEESEPTLAEKIAYLRENGNLHMPKHKVRLIKEIKTAYDAAVHIAEVGNDPVLRRFIEEQLSINKTFKGWRSNMPSKTPHALTTYQQRMSQSSVQDITNTLNEIGVKLSNEQYLFHGGHWCFGKEFVTTRPLSTTLCPEVAYIETFHGGKAYDAGQIDLWVLKVINPSTNIFVYKHNGTSMGHEKEILLNAGAKITLKSKTRVRDNVKVTKILPNSCNEISKLIPVNVLEMEVS